jgi:hypothetical protein
MVNVAGTSPRDMELLKALLENNKGKYKSYIHLLEPKKSETIIYLGDNARLEISDNIKKEADEILGTGTTKFM